MSLTFCYDYFDKEGNPISLAYKPNLDKNESPVNMGSEGYDYPHNIKENERNNMVVKFKLKNRYQLDSSLFEKFLITDTNIKTISDVNTKYYYIVDVFPHNFWIDERSKYPSFDDKLIDDIKNKKAKILVLFITEALKNEHKSFIEDIFQEWINQYNLPKNSIIICSGAYNFVFENSDYVKHIFFPYFEFYMRDFYNKNNSILMEHAILVGMKRNKTFLCYNRRPHHHRQKFVYFLYKMDLLKYGLTSLADLNEKEQKIPDVSSQFINTLPLTFDDTDLQKNQARTLYQKDYLNTYFSIVTETLMDDIFPSEKIYKPILMLHPFIVVSVKNYLKMLKDMGYKTFSKWFDESYDNEENKNRRIGKIIVETKRLCKLSEERKQKMLIQMLPILKHNLENYLKRTENRLLQKQLEDELWK